MQTRWFPNARGVVVSVVTLAVVTMGAARGGASGFDLATRHTDNTLPDGLYNSRNADVTPDGRYVVFESQQEGLVTPATNGLYQIFLRDRVLGTTELVSVNSAGTQGNAASYHAAISDDGCLVVFHSSASNLASANGTGDANGFEDVFLRNRCSGPQETIRISVDGAGSPLLTASTTPDISADGRYVAFASGGNILRYDVAAGTSNLLTDGNFASASPSISADGARIAFWSYADDLVVGDLNGLWDIFLWDAVAPTRIVSTTAGGVQQEQGQEGISTLAEPAISGDGRYVAFRSRTTNLLPGDTGGFSHVYVKDLQTGAVARASVSSSGTLGNGDSSGGGAGVRPGISFDGKWVAFSTVATNLTADTGGMTPNIVARNMLTGDTVGFFANGTSDDAPVFSGDAHARYVTMFSTASLDPRFDSSGVFLHDRHTAPVAEAGAPQAVDPNTLVTLDGSGSHASANAYLAPDPVPALVYTWSQLEGPAAVTFSDPHVVAPTFTPTAFGTYRFQLVVSDTIAGSAPDEVTIEVIDPSTPRVTVLSPNGGEVWTLGSKVTIQWTLANFSPRKKVIIALTKDGGNTLIPVAIKPGSKGSFRVKLPKKRKLESDTMLLAVCVPGTKKPKTDPICDTSDATFTITR